MPSKVDEDNKFSEQKHTVRYKYAFSPDVTIIDIDTVAQGDRGDYTCISCGGKLIAVIGQKRKRHFRHAVLTESCSLETYLHHMGKLLFYGIYRSCLKSANIYNIAFARPRSCNHCNEVSDCGMPNELFTYSLTNFFKEILLEKTDGNFIPDLLLLTDSGEKIYIEIVVSHHSTHNKISSGVRIIEIKIESEDDFTLLNSCLLSEEDDRVEFFNFDRKPISDDYSSECYNEVAVFILNVDGSATIKKMDWFKYEILLKDKGPYYKIVECKNSHSYRRELEQAYLDGLTVKNCFLCRYHGKPTGYQREDTGKSIFCRFQELYYSNYGSQCKFYRPDKKRFKYKK